VIYSDAASLARVADALLTVARVGFLHRSSARELRRITAQWDLRRIGFVLTGLPEKSSRYGYAYGYGYRQSGQGKHQADEETWPPYTGGDTTEPVGADPYSSRGQLQ
jgi:Mrp family chromosome partitioning ATPase